MCEYCKTDEPIPSIEDINAQGQKVALLLMSMPLDRYEAFAIASLVQFCHLEDTLINLLRQTGNVDAAERHTRTLLDNVNALTEIFNQKCAEQKDQSTEQNRSPYL